MVEWLFDAIVLVGMFVFFSFGFVDLFVGVGIVVLIGGAIVFGFVALVCYLWLRCVGCFEIFVVCICLVVRACWLFVHLLGILFVGFLVVIWVLEGFNLVVIVKLVGFDLVL